MAIKRGHTGVACSKLQELQTQLTGLANNGVLTSAQAQEPFSLIAGMRNALGCSLPRWNNDGMGGRVRSSSPSVTPTGAMPLRNPPLLNTTPVLPSTWRLSR